MLTKHVSTFDGWAVEAWDDGAAAFNDGESPYCLAHRLCRASFAGFGSGRALLAGGVMGTRGDRGDDGAAAFDDGGSPNCLAHRLCRASFAGFGSGRALLADGVMGVGGGSGEGARRPDRDTW